MILNDSLTAWGGAEISPGVLEGWRRRGLDRLLPFQARALRSTGLMRGENVMLAAPTSSGKTLPAEFAVARALHRRQKAVYLVPTRALAEEKRAAFEQWLAPTGLRVACATRDRPETDRLAAAGDFDLLVAVYEKLNHYLLVRPEMAAGIGVVVIDEIQSLTESESERGGRLDLLLTRLRRSPYPAQLVALGPEIPEAPEIARWLGCELMTDRRRPRELREGVLDVFTGRFRFRTVGDEEEGEESLADAGELERLCAELEAEHHGRIAPAAAMLAAAAWFARHGERVILFAPTRRASRQWAEALSRLGVGTPARLALPRLANLEPTRSNALLRRCMENGVAFHNADLPGGLRAVVEEAFNNGELRLLAATPTLGLGVNLAADNALHCPWRVESRAGLSAEASAQAGAGRPVMAPLGRRRFEDQGGRAARLGLGRGWGRSILVAPCPDEARRLWEEFMNPPREAPPAPPLASLPPASVVIDLLAGGVRRTTANLGEALTETFSARCAAGEVSSEIAALRLERELERCRRLEMIRTAEPDGMWMLTGLGEAAAHLGLRVETVAAMRGWLTEGFLARADASGDAQLPHFDLFAALALTADGRRAQAGLGWAGRCLDLRLDPEAMEAIDRQAAPDGPARRILARRGGPTREELAALMTALALADWIGPTPTDELEQRWRVYYGSLARVAGEFAWLTGGLAAAARVLGRAAALARAARRLSERLALGIPEQGLGLARLHAPGLTRGPIARLLAAGLDAPEAIAAADFATVEQCVGQDLARELREAARRARERRRATRGAKDRKDKQDARDEKDGIGGNSGNDPAAARCATRVGAPCAAPSEAAASDAPALLEIDLQSPGVIRWGGREVLLPPLGFEFLAALAERPGEVVTRAALYRRLWPDGGPEDQQLDAHRRVLIRRLRTGAGDAAAGAPAPPPIQVVRGMGFRLAHPPEAVRLRRG